jgi:hypothetical protein
MAFQEQDHGFIVVDFRPFAMQTLESTHLDYACIFENENGNGGRYDPASARLYDTREQAEAVAHNRGGKVFRVSDEQQEKLSAAFLDEHNFYHHITFRQFSQIVAEPTTKVINMTNRIVDFDTFNQQVQAFHQNAVLKGFYEKYPTIESRQNSEYRVSRGTLVTGEFFEAYEAYRKGRINADSDKLHELQEAMQQAIPVEPDEKDTQKIITSGIMGAHFISLYDQSVKGTIAEELADVYIRICDTVGGFQLRPLKGEDSFSDMVFEQTEKILKDNDTPQCLFWHCTRIIKDFLYFREPMYKDIALWLAAVYALAHQFKITLPLQIDLKFIYNKYRAYKHGKDF